MGIDDLVIRHRYSTDAQYTYKFESWVMRPETCSGPRPNTVVPMDDLQRVMDRACARFGDPSRDIDAEHRARVLEQMQQEKGNPKPKRKGKR